MTPDERTAKTLAAIPPGPACIQYADPRTSLKLILGAGQPFASYITGSIGGDHVFDSGLLPNPDEACRHLFPNVIWSHNDGKTLRWHTRESLAMPGEAVGIEAYILASMASGIR